MHKTKDNKHRKVTLSITLHRTSYGEKGKVTNDFSEDKMCKNGPNRKQIFQIRKRSEQTSNWIESILVNRWIKLEANHIIWKTHISSSQRKNKGKQNLPGKTNISNGTRRACFKYEATSDVTVFQPLPGEWERNLNTGTRGSRLCNHRKSNHSVQLCYSVNSV